MSFVGEKERSFALLSARAVGTMNSSLPASLAVALSVLLGALSRLLDGYLLGSKIKQ